jgi:flagella basal body P-ring formation protein FlgA
MRFLRILLLISVVASSGAAAGEDDKQLTLLSSARIRGSRVFLSDVVKEDLSRDEKIFVAVSPGWLSQKVIRAGFIRNLLKNKDIRLTGAECVTIRREVQNRSAEVRERVERIISQKLAASRWHHRCKSLDFRLIDFPEELVIPTGRFNVECSLPRQLHGPRNVSFTVEGRDRFKRRYSVKTDFMMMVECPVALRSIRRGEKIEQSDITWIEKNLADCYREPASRRDGIADLQASRLITEGEIIGTDALQRVPLITQGDEVEIVLSRGSLTVRVTGRSLENGYRGDRIMIRNGANGKIEKYCVIDRGKVSPERLEVGSR